MEAGQHRVGTLFFSCLPNLRRLRPEKPQVLLLRRAREEEMRRSQQISLSQAWEAHKATTDLTPTAERLVR